MENEMIKTAEGKAVRVHRVGTITLGITLVAAGFLFLFHLVFPALSYEMIFRCWPVLFISLGLEILIANKHEEHFNYDAGALVMLIILMFFAMGMAGADLLFTHYSMFFQ